MAMMSRSTVDSMGFASVGENVLISDRATFYGIDRIKIGNHVRIDDFCVIAAGEGGVEIGNNVHIAVFSSLIGRGKITLSDFSGLSSRVSIYSSSDDYSGKWMTNPTIPSEFTGVQHADVYIGRHVIVGSSSVILPGVVVEEGVAIGALSLVRKKCFAFGIYMGIPAKRIAERKHDLLELERKFLSSMSNGKIP